jgi:hypothetical protein
MERRDLQKLMEQAKQNPKFLHALVFDPESILRDIDYLDRNVRAKLIGNNPEEVVAALCGARSLVETEGYSP